MIANSSVRGNYPVTPDDTNKLPQGHCQAIYVGGTGNLAIVDENNQTVTFTGIAAGIYHPICAKLVKATGTTATGLIAGYF